MLRSLFLFLLIFCATATASAQTYRAFTLNVQDGLIGEQVYDVTQDEDGLMWIATNNGLCSFDGISFSAAADTMPTQPNTRLRQLSKNRTLAVGTDDFGWFRLRLRDEGIWRDVALPPQLRQNQEVRMWALLGDAPEEELAIYAADTIYLIDLKGGPATKMPVPKAISASLGRLVGHGNDLYALTKNGLYLLSNNRWNRMGEDLKLSQHFTSLAVTPDDDIFVSGADWIGSVVDGVLEPFPFKPVDDETAITNLEYNRNGFLFFRSNKSFYWYHIASGESLAFRTSKGDANPQGSRIYFDQEDNLWITSTRGLHRISSFRFQCYSAFDGLGENEVSAVAEMAPDVYVVGGQQSYSIINGNVVTTKPLPKGPGLTRVSNIVTVDKGATRKVYLGGQSNGVGELLADHSIRWRRFVDQVELLATIDNNLWVAGPHGQLFEEEDNTWKPRPSPRMYTRNLYRLQDGTMIACTSDGLMWMEGGVWKKTKRYPKPRANHAVCFAELDGKRWVGTQVGLFEWRGDSLVRQPFSGHYLDGGVFAILSAGPEEFWFGTEAGVVVIKGSQLFRYGPSEGLAGYDVNRGAMIINSKGQIMIGTNGGLNIYDQKMDWPHSQVFKPEIISLVTSDDQKQLASEPIRLAHSSVRGGIRFNVRSITFSDEEVKFRYRLNGFDQTWQRLSSDDQRSVLYRNLPDGEFVFEVQSALGSGAWSESVYSGSILVTAPYYRAWWFYVLVIGLTLTVGYGINTSLSQYSRNRKLQAMVDEKVEEIRVNEDKLRIALDNSKMGAWTYHLSEDRLTLTPRVYEFLNLNHVNSPKLDDILAAVHPDDRVLLSEKIQSSLKNLESLDMEARVEASSRRVRWVHIKGKAINRGDGKGHMISGTLNEITRRKKLEADRERMIAELERTNRELDRFVYSASHDLSAPLKSVLGLINISKMSGSQEETLTYLTMMEKSVQKLDTFIKDIISYSRNSRLEVAKDEVNMTELLNDVLENFKFDELFKKTEVSVSIAPEASIMTTDKQRLKIILNNLISNALKFRKRISEGQHGVTIRAFMADGRRVIEVTDNGEGIAEMHVKKIFDMFYRANDHVWGSGLGLYIARETAEKMGFHLEVDSTLGEGSTFRLREKLG